MSKKNKYYALLHLTVLIFGLTGVLGKAINASEEVIVFYRLAFAIGGLFVYFKITGFTVDFSISSIKKTYYVGIILAIHWLTFFAAIKASNVSIALICFSSSTLFTAFLEPLYYERKIVLYEVVLGLCIMVGLYFLCKEPDKSIFDSRYILGIFLSVFSAFLAAWFTVINGALITKGKSAKNIAYLELLFALATIIIYLFISNEMNPFPDLFISGADLFWCVVLGVVCTSFAYLASVAVMKKISPYTVSMSVNLEPVYAILLATFLWPESEKMQPSFYIGVVVILIIVMLNAFLKRRTK